MGTALRDFVTKTPATSLPDKGRFEKEMVPKLQNYYGKAIKQNHQYVDAMHEAIWASFHHMSSTDGKHNHSLCPKGKTSWCFFQQAQAKGEVPGKHPEHDHLPAVVSKGLMPIYEKMANKDLLQRCVAGKTTNPNEAIHNVLWDQCSKEIFVSLSQVRIACINTIHQYNEGHIGLARQMSSLKLPMSPEAGYRMTKIDAAKEQRMTEKSKKGKVDRSKRKLDASKTAGPAERKMGRNSLWVWVGWERVGEKEEIKNNNKGFGVLVTFYFYMNQLDFCKDFSVPF
jgi:hypothetical protein